jgi:hypothetical protein
MVLFLKYVPYYKALTIVTSECILSHSTMLTTLVGDTVYMAAKSYDELWSLYVITHIVPYISFSHS